MNLTWIISQISEARALYNLGNVYHAKGKHAGRNFHQDPGNFPEEVRQSLEKAVEFYEWVAITFLFFISSLFLFLVILRYDLLLTAPVWPHPMQNNPESNFFEDWITTPIRISLMIFASTLKRLPVCVTQSIRIVIGRENY